MVSSSKLKKFTRPTSGAALLALLAGLDELIIALELAPMLDAALLDDEELVVDN